VSKDFPRPSAHGGVDFGENIEVLVRNLIAIFILGWSLSLNASATSIESVYTNLAHDSCKTIEEDKESGFSVQKCAGVAGYSLLVEDADPRQSITVVTPDGRRHPLDYWQVITTAFSTVGDKAEWRVEREGAKARPIALIVRVYANEDPDSIERRTSYLAVAKITPKKICVTAKVKGGATANEEARRAADSSAEKSCLQ
jgi:hypothetical protein